MNPSNSFILQMLNNIKSGNIATVKIIINYCTTYGAVFYSISTSYSYASANKKLEILIVFNKGITNQRLKYYMLLL